MIHCSDMRCKYCNDKYVCTNKNVQLNSVGICTVNKGFKNYLECKSFEESNLYKDTMKLLKELNI